MLLFSNIKLAFFRVCTFSLIPEALHEANKRVVSLSREPHEAGPGPKCAKNTYSSYFAEDRARIGRYAAEHGKTKASQHFMVPELLPVC